MIKKQLTQTGYDNLVSELGKLREKRETLITRIEDVALPDENGEDVLVVQLKDELTLINSKIEEIERTIENCEIISKMNTDTVQVGTMVKLEITGGTLREFSVVDEMEADPSQNRISDKSPLGMALLGKKNGDMVEFEAPMGAIAYKIKSIKLI